MGGKLIGDGVSSGALVLVAEMRGVGLGLAKEKLKKEVGLLRPLVQPGRRLEERKS